MSWTFEDFSVELEDLADEVRQKALEIANQLRQEKNYSKERAIRKAIEQAEEWYYNLEG